MNDRARQKLIQILETEQPGILEEQDRLEALLRDYCGDCRKEISALMAALRHDIPNDLRRSRNDPYPILTSRLATRLDDEGALSPEAADWSVKAWATALRIGPGAEQSPNQPSWVTPPQTPPLWSPGEVLAPASVAPPLPRPTENQAARPWTPYEALAPPMIMTDPRPGQNQVGVTPPAHNSFLVGAISFGAAVLILILISAEIAVNGFWKLLGFLALVACALEVLLGFVRIQMKKPQPPSWVALSLSFWMSLFGLEDRVLGIAGRRNKPAPVPPPPLPMPNISVQYFEPPAQPISAPASPAAPQTMGTAAIAAGSGAGLRAAPTQGVASSVYCIECGIPNEPDRVFCSGCGAKLFHPGAAES
jgi:hypothetical protein